MGIAGVLFAAVLCASPAPLVSRVGDVEVDHEQGTVTARAGAAADLRMPNPNAARPGAERRALAAADERLRQALAILAQRIGEGLHGDVDAAMTNARTTQVEYQSNGGVFLWRQVRFADLSGGKAISADAVVLSVPSMPARVAPTFRIGEGKAAPAYALLRRGTPERRPPVGKWDPKAGQLVFPAKSVPVEKVNGAVVVIYVGKLEP